MDLDLYIRNEIIRAIHIFEAAHSKMRADHSLSRFLLDYHNSITQSQSLMKHFGISEGCRICAQSIGGSCCFEGIETGYDHILLTVNLLMGCKLSNGRINSGSCWFLGPHGCTLKARHYFCVHYLCPDLHDILTEAQRSALMIAIGKELSSGWEVERCIRFWLRKNIQG